MILKEKVKGLENALHPRPLFVEPIVAIQPLYNLEGVPKTSSRLKISSRLLMTVIKYTRDQIHKMIALILEIWELATSSTALSTRVLHFKEYLQNDEIFYKEVVGTFSAKVLSLMVFIEESKAFLLRLD
jgi:hypothetical protein